MVDCGNITYLCRLRVEDILYSSLNTCTRFGDLRNSFRHILQYQMACHGGKYGIQGVGGC